ncbi:MAG: alpha-L-fucosidase [Prolixibacteraceae bacterium]|jgi:alpha-L-fucosidase
MKVTSYPIIILLFLSSMGLRTVSAQESLKASKLHELQQKFVDLRFGMFIHYNIPTYTDEDWPDPDAPASLFNPKKLDCDQWAKAAKSANMSYGCLTTKHHSGFCIWDTKTSDYNVMNSPLKRDVVKEFADAFRANGLKVMLYYSILDTHDRLRPQMITRRHIEMIKEQITELLTKYGKIEALIIDGWDAPWSRISYDDVPFDEIYHLVKSIQPDCLFMDLNSAKYPEGTLFYTDIKSYEQNAGQSISKEINQLPALSCLPLQQNWFWKTSFPTSQLKSAEALVNNDIVPLNNAHCNFILNVAPNRDGLIDENALQSLKQIGKLWKNQEPTESLSQSELPVISKNIAKFKPASSSWSNDMWIMDFANDDDFGSAWQSNRAVEKPWLAIDLERTQPFNMITIVEPRANINKYTLQYQKNGKWETIFSGENANRFKLHRFDEVWGSKVRIQIENSSSPATIAEFGVYQEQR